MLDGDDQEMVSDKFHSNRVGGKFEGTIVCIISEINKLLPATTRGEDQGTIFDIIDKKK